MVKKTIFKVLSGFFGLLFVVYLMRAVLVIDLGAFSAYVLGQVVGSVLVLYVTGTLSLYFWNKE
jgi:hypothetical protein